MKYFALIGVGGFVAPRHLRAIKETGNKLLAALDKSDSVGILDDYFPEARFFTEFERFDRHLEKLKRSGQKIDYLTICSPNYLHDSHIRFGLRLGADVICEKPLVLNPWNLEPLKEIEKETGKRVFTILQLRLHPGLVKLKRQIDQQPKEKNFDVELTYISARGQWYHSSWKGDLTKSGGIATNIGIHFFDLLIWIFGPLVSNTTHQSSLGNAAGVLKLKRASVNWFLSVDGKDLPPSVAESGQRTFRSIKVDGSEIQFSEGFSDLHSQSYQEILNGNGFGIDDSAAAIELAALVRSQLS